MKTFTKSKLQLTLFRGPGLVKCFGNQFYKLIIIFILTGLASFNSFSQVATSPFNFTQIPVSDPDIVSPARGVEHWNRLSPGPFRSSDNQIEVGPGVGEVMDAYARFSWWEMEPGQGVYNWSKFDQFVQTCINKRKKASFGIMTQLAGEGNSVGGAVCTYPVYVHNQMQTEASNARDWVYGGAWVPNYNSNYYLTAFENLNNALAAHINNTVYNGVRFRDVINYIDIRGYGEFGEWHHYPYIDAIPSGRVATVATLKRIIDAHKNAFPNFPLLALISGYDPGASANTPAEVTHYLLTQSNAWGRYGWRWDSWGQSIYSAILENNPGSFNGMRFDTAIANRFRQAPVGGEPSSWEAGVSNNGASSLYYLLPSQITRYGASFFGNGNYNVGSMGTAERNNFYTASKNCGYRIILTGGSMATNVSTGAAFNITLNYRNIGIAPVYEKWHNVYELRNSSGTVVWKDTSYFRLRHFQPSGTSTAVSESFTLPTSVAPGTYNLYLIIRDSTQYRSPFPLAITGRNADGSYLLRSNINVTSGGVTNAAPSANAGANQTITLPASSATVSGTGTDSDGSISSFSWTKVSGPSGGAIQSPTSASTLITGLLAGIYIYRLTVTDNNGARASDDMQITVVDPTPPSPPNAPPFANAGGDQTVTLPANTATLNGSANDPDGSIASYAWTKLSGPAGGTLQTPNAAVTDVAALVAGTYVFRLTVTDNAGATHTDDIQIIVNSAPLPPNQAPTANAGPDQVITLPVNTTTLNGSGTDADGTIASFAWTKVSGPAGGTISSANTASTGITGLVAGVYVFRLTVTDNRAATATNTIQVTVNSAPAPNAAPTANAGPNRNITLPVNTTTVNGSGTDTDGTIASFAWTKVSGPAGGNLQSPAAASTSITGLNAGTYVFRLTVTDNDGATATDNVSVIVSASLAPSPSNQAPVANAGNNITITLPVNNASLAGSGTDADGSIATYSWTKVSGPTGGNIQSNNTASTNITSLIAGTYVYRLTVTDNAGAQSSDDVQVTVNPAPAPVGNQAPIANAGTNRSITLPTNSVSFTGSGTDPDGTIAGYSWSKVSGPAGGTIQTPNTATTNITGLTAGTYVFRLTVTDNDGASASDDIQLIVNAAPVLPNQAPIANAGRDISITLPVNSAILNGSASTDPDGSIVSYSWRKVQGPNGSSLTANNTAAATASDLTKGVFEYELTVTDNRGGTATDRVMVTVIRINKRPIAQTTRDTINVVLPVQNTELNAASSYDPDGTISNYQWTYTKGPKEPKVLAPTAPKTVVTDLVAGTYSFNLVVTDNDGDKTSKSVVVIVSNSSSRRQVPDVSIYPNPATGLVNVKINTPVEGRTTLTFVDMNGRPVLTDSFVKGFSSFTRQVNISSLPKGTYAVIIQVDQTEKVVEKVIKF